ncbi:hypothetical protein F5141DRAFT_1118700 [Pisolithus sp. B1]|nr:hypothetical protein F5141DRAFT_1118700 [Pisolithus sp. B1]
MGMVSPEALLPLISIVLTFLDLVLIVARRREFLRVPGVCAKSLRAGFDGAGESFSHLALSSLSRLMLLLQGSCLAVRRFLGRFALFRVDPGGTPSHQ